MKLSREESSETEEAYLTWKMLLTKANLIYKSKKEPKSKNNSFRMVSVRKD